MSGTVRVESYRALDALVAERVMGWPAVSGDYPLRGVKAKGYIWEGRIERIDSTRGFVPSRRIADSWEVVERLAQMQAEGHAGPTRLHCLAACSGYRYSVEFCSDFGVIGPVKAATAPLAICLAALRAKGVEVDLALPEGEDHA